MFVSVYYVLDHEEILNKFERKGLKLQRVC